MNKATLQQIFSTNAGFGALALRVPVGIIFAAHGAQKLFGWFGGYGLEGTGGWMESIGLAPGVLMAFLAGAAEFFGGLASGVWCVNPPCGCDFNYRHVGGHF